MDKDEMVKQEVLEMGDNNYVCRSERARLEGREVGLAEGRKVGLTEGRKVGLTEGRKVGLTEGRMAVHLIG